MCTITAIMAIGSITYHNLQPYGYKMYCNLKTLYIDQ